ncbi:MAG: LacI family DNA-binding transcriptional regulator [Propioniciclava sp.]
MQNEPDRPSLGRRATISDVAQATGVSRTTVSLVLADAPRISDATKQRVRSAMAELGYVYNRAATAVRHGRSLLIGLLVTDIRNPFFADLTMGIDRALGARGSNPILGFSFGSPERESQIALSLVEQMVGGLILLPTGSSRAEGLSCLTGPAALPLVQLLREVPEVESDYVGVDNVASGRMLGEHLASRGVQRALFVGDERTAQYDDRLAGLAHGLTSGDVHPVVGGPPGLAATSLTGVEAVVTYNDTHLLSVLHLLTDAGRDPGRDIYTASFDNTPVAADARPSVTSVDHHAARMADVAADLLARRMDNPGLPRKHETVPGELVIRASTAG